MIKILRACFDPWLRPILFFGSTLGLLGASALIQNKILETFSSILFGIGLFGLFISTFYQLVQKRWLKGLLTGLLFGGTMMLMILYSLLLFAFESVDGDKWADDLKIPTDLPIETPIDLTLGNERPDSVLAWKKSKTDFQLYNSFQPGLYEFDFWTGEIESGIIYLKAFEITQEYPLSTNRLPERSSIKIHNPTDQVLKFGTKSDFTIYEGDWGKPYAARFEVWFKPGSGAKERKLFMKNYKIEGWQR